MARKGNGTSDVLLSPVITLGANYSWHAYVKGTATAGTSKISQPVVVSTSSGDAIGMSWDHTSSTFSGAAQHRRSGGWVAVKFGTLTGSTLFSLGASYDGATLKTYQDGVFKNSASATAHTVTASPKVSVLAGSYGTASFSDATCSEVAVWDVALTAGEWAALAAGVPASQIRPANLLIYVPARGDESPEPDLSGSALNLTVSGTTKVNHSPVALLYQRSIIEEVAGGTTYNLTTENLTAIASIIDATITQQKTLTTETLNASALISDVTITSSIDLVLSSLVAQGVIDDVSVSIGNVYNLLLDAMVSMGEISDASVSQLKNISLEGLNASALLSDVGVGRVSNATLDALTAGGYVNDISVNQVRALSLETLNAQASLDDITVTLGVVYNLLCDALDASSLIPDVAIDQTKTVLLDALNAVAVAGEISVAQLRALLLDDVAAVGNLADVAVVQSVGLTLDELNAFADLNSIIVTDGDFYTMVFDALDAQAVISDVTLVQVRNLVLDDLAARGAIDDLAFLKQLPLQIIAPSIFSMTETLMVSSFTEQTFIQQIH